MTQARLRIGTRGSPLALAQAHELRDRLRAAHDELREPDAIEIRIIRTTGDKVQDRPLAEIGGKGLFTKEIEEALIDRQIDAAVHSMKDVETHLPPGLEISTLLEREDPRDVLIARAGTSLASLPEGTVVGSASLRRKAQILLHRPDLPVVNLRGNVGTRLQKLTEGKIGATLLALAGLKRLGMQDRATALLSTDEMLPAPGQGAIGIEIRAEDAATRRWLAPLDHRATRIAVTAERALLATLDGSCRTPIAALAEAGGDRLSLRALIALPDGSDHHRATIEGPAAEAEALGREAGRALKAKAGPSFFARLQGA
ncbi:porphobilinogen deaminase [Hypericibacter adhaerens]|uniref:Porphobilinogen deaminase n=1 Tax=Hypericibacter adhaerens TaxID=2602016 RepID=A0A5J6N5T4_9PROT|nr:hydroxymethylbilane synthase [Hypericibacter adhaerens]QEX25221.1 porphobilinogen deaminase [Hypericibacter adhaerens]